MSSDRWDLRITPWQGLGRFGFYNNNFNLGLLFALGLYSGFRHFISSFLSLSQLRPVRNLFQKSRQHGPSFFAHRSRQDHPLRLQAEYLSWLEVCDDDHFAPDQFFRLVILRDAGQYLARL